MTAGAIVLYKYFILNYIALFSLYRPSPHRFYSVPLQCGGWNNKPITELIVEMKGTVKEYNYNVEQYSSTIKELKTLVRAIDLDMKLPDKSQNWEMKQIMKHY